MAFKIKFPAIQSGRLVGVLAPGLAIYAFVTFLGGFVPLCASSYRIIFGKRPLPGITDSFISAVSGSSIRLHLVGLGIMLVFWATAYLIGRNAPSEEIALRRLFVLVTLEWCCVAFAMNMTLVALFFPIAPIYEYGEQLDISVLPSFASALVKSGKAVIYEGLPRPDFESNLFQSEKRTKPTVKIHGYYFYKEPTEFSRDDTVEFESMLATDSAFIDWGGLKLCGEYHPDFAIEWQDAAGSQYDALICFGCNEAKFYGPGVPLHCDVGRTASKILRPMLFKYGKNRPR